MTLSGPDHVDQGVPYDLTRGSVTNADANHVVDYVVHLGDNSPLLTINPSANNGMGVAADHVYHTNGIYTVTVTATEASKTR